MCVNDRIKTHCVVKAGFDVTGSVRCRTVIITDAYRKRLNTSLEIRSDRCAEDSELILRCGLNTDNGIRSEHIRAQVERSAASERRYESFVSLYYLLHGFNELFLGIYRHLKARCGLLESLSVKIGTEHYRSAVLGRICLKAFENSLGIL